MYSHGVIYLHADFCDQREDVVASLNTSITQTHQPLKFQCIFLLQSLITTHIIKNIIKYTTFNL